MIRFLKPNNVMISFSIFNNVMIHFLVRNCGIVACRERIVSVAMELVNAKVTPSFDEMISPVIL